MSKKKIEELKEELLENLEILEIEADDISEESQKIRISYGGKEIEVEVKGGLSLEEILKEIGYEYEEERKESRKYKPFPQCLVIPKSLLRAWAREMGIKIKRGTDIYEWAADNHEIVSEYIFMSREITQRNRERHLKGLYQILLDKCMFDQADRYRSIIISSF